MSLSARFFARRRRATGKDTRAFHEADVLLVRAARRGDEAALQRLCRRMSLVPDLLAYMLRRVRAGLGPDDTGELVQETCAALWARLGSFQGRSSLETWVYGFCGTQVIKSLERRRRRQRTVYGHQPDQMEARPEDRARFEFEWLHAALADLESPDGEIIRMRHFEELGYEEIGQRFELPANTVKTRYHRALQRLKERLGSTWRAETEGDR